MQRGEGDAAIKEFQEAIRLRPDDSGFRGNLGIAYLQLSNFDAAEEQLRQALKMVPDNASLHYDLALTLKLKDNLPAAITEMKQGHRTRSEVGGHLLHAGCHPLAAGRISGGGRATAEGGGTQA